MIGAIAGDIIGSVYEGKKQWLATRTADFQPLFSPRARFTDDTVLTVAVADALMHGGDLSSLLKEYYEQYPGAGFGGEFKRWAASDAPEPYGSWGNGSAMRVSPVAWAFGTLDEVLHRAKETACVTHNHVEGIKGAQATAVAVFLARSGVAKWELRDEVERRFHYDLSFALDDIRPTYAFDSSCAGTVPPAIVAFLESSDFESAVRLAISLGGDCDTLACIAGAIAAAFYGVPGPIREQALARLDEPLSEILAEFERRYPDAARQAGPVSSNSHSVAGPAEHDPSAAEEALMSQPWVILTRRYGGGTRSPTVAQLAEAVAELYHETLPDMTEDDYAEHRAAWLRYGYDDGPMYVLEVSRLREVTLEEWADQDYEQELAPPRSLHKVPEDQALRLLRWLAEGQIDRVRLQPWE